MSFEFCQSSFVVICLNEEFCEWWAVSFFLSRLIVSCSAYLEIKKAREEKHLTQEQLAELVDKKRTYISRIENDGSNMTLKTLFDIVEKGLGGKVNISIQL